ncbi:MAG: molybdopterin-dependent oxidoreductase [Geobacteraceae bacterium]|nr:molybdopterin-dependent oxidoreductase [Geobacteraceae bacterium]
MCHDKKLKPFGACRMCLVEVEQMKGRQIPACTTPVTEGMIIRTSTPDIVKARKMVLELLLLNHPLDCPVCDKAGDCDLQNLTYEYKVDSNRFTDEKFHHKIDYNNPLIERDMNRCVLCGKCARICDEIVGFGALTFIDRGIETKIGCEFEDGLNCEFCGSCISVCPVGSLLARPFKFKARFWSLTKQKSVCGYCGTGCNLTLGVKDNKVLTTLYDENQGFHNGQLCVRGRFGYQFINSDQRLTSPLMRTNGRLIECSWEDALAAVASRLTGGNSVAALATPRLTNEELFLMKKLMDSIGTSNYDHSAGYAHAALTEGFANSLGVNASTATILDVQKTDLLLVVKTDAYETHPVIGFEINMGVKNKGIKLNIISDKRGKLSKLPSANTLVHSPGSEVAVLNSIAKSIIDEKLTSESAASVPGFAELEKALAAFTPEAVAATSGISADSIKKLAKDYASAEKALILFPVGHAYPGHNQEMATAVANLAILTGKVGKEGCGVLCLSEKNNSQGAVDMGFYAQNGGMNSLQILDACKNGSVKTLFIAGENPVVSYPNGANVKAALDAVDFLVVSELFMTETAAMADVVLPACSFAEKEGTFTSTDRRVQYVKPAIRKNVKCKTDFEIISALIAKLGAQAPASPAAVFAEITSSTPAYSGMSYLSLGTEGAFAQVNVTPRLLAPKTAPAVAAETGKLAMVTGSALYHSGTLSQFGEGPMFVCPEAYVEMSRSDASKYKLTDKDLVTVSSPTGSIKLKVKVSPRMPEGVVYIPYHFSEAPVNVIWNGSAVTMVSIAK